MDWVVLAAVIVGVLATALGLRRFLQSRYRELYGAEEPPYQDPPALPNLPGPSGGPS